MKTLLVLITFLTSMSCFSEDDNRIKQLEDRIKALEAQNGSTADSAGLKVKDMNGKGAESSSSSASIADPSMALEKKKEIIDKLKAFQVRREQELKLLEEMDKEGY